MNGAIIQAYIAERIYNGCVVVTIPETGFPEGLYFRRHKCFLRKYRLHRSNPDYPECITVPGTVGDPRVWPSSEGDIPFYVSVCYGDCRTSVYVILD